MYYIKGGKSMNDYGVVFLVAELITICVTIILGLIFKNVVTQSGNKQSAEKIAEYNERIYNANKKIADHKAKALKEKIEQNNEEIGYIQAKSMSEKIAELDKMLEKGEITSKQYKEQKNKIIMEA